MCDEDIAPRVSTRGLQVDLVEGYTDLGFNENELAAIEEAVPAWVGAWRYVVKGGVGVGMGYTFTGPTASDVLERHGIRRAYTREDVRFCHIETEIRRRAYAEMGDERTEVLAEFQAAQKRKRNGIPDDPEDRRDLHEAQGRDREEVGVVE